MLTWWAATLWALLGSSLSEAVDYNTFVRQNNRVPWKRGRTLLSFGVYASAAGTRLFIGAGLGAGLGASGLVDDPFSAILVGVAGYSIVQKLGAATSAVLPSGAADPGKPLTSAGGED